MRLDDVGRQRDIGTVAPADRTGRSEPDGFEGEPDVATTRIGHEPAEEGSRVPPPSNVERRLPGTKCLTRPVHLRRAPRPKAEGSIVFI